MLKGTITVVCGTGINVYSGCFVQINGGMYLNDEFSSGEYGGGSTTAYSTSSTDTGKERNRGLCMPCVICAVHLGALAQLGEVMSWRLSAAAGV